MTRELVNEVLDGVVPQVLATLDGAEPELLGALAVALERAEPPVFYFASPVRNLIVNREAGEPADRLVEINLRSALRRAAAWEDGALVEDLERAQAPFWVEVRRAVEELVEVLPEPRLAEHFVGGDSFATPDPSRQTA